MAVIAVLDCAVYVSRAAKAPDKVATSTAQTTPLKPPDKGPINVAFVISEGANVMDIAGPWEVFSDAMLTSKGKPWHEADGDDMIMPFNTYTVSDSLKPVNAVSGLMIVPNYSFETAPLSFRHREAAATPRKHGCCRIRRRPTSPCRSAPAPRCSPSMACSTA